MRTKLVTQLLTDVTTALRSGHPGQTLEALFRKGNLLSHYHPDAVIRPEVIILAGKGSPLSRKQKEEWVPFIHQLLSGFEGTVISGGTVSGIPGLAGETAAEWFHQERKKFHLIGYLPEKLPEGAGKSPGYDQFITSQTDDFSPEEVLNYWVDILFREITPESILLAGISGGALSLFEYQLAMALGAKVALLKDSGGAVKKIQQDPYWASQPNLMTIMPQSR